MKTGKPSLKSTHSAGSVLTERKTLQLIAEKIRESKKVVLIGHKGPDYDCVGSLMALYSVLKAKRKRVRVLSDFGRDTWYYFKSFHPDVTKKISKSFKPDLAIMVDYGARRILEKGALEILRAKKPFVITLDHHQKSDQVGDIVFIDDAKHSNCELLLDLFQKMKVSLREEARIALLAGMWADTGGFAHYSLTPKIVSKIKKLIISGAEFTRAMQIIKTWHRLKDFIFYAKSLSQLKIDENTGLGYVVIKGPLPSNQSFTSTVANTVCYVHGIEVVAVMRNTGKGVFRVSLRAANSSVGVIDVSKIASYFGGGGHLNAAAFQIKMSSVKIIRKVKELIREQQLKIKSRT